MVQQADGQHDRRRVLVQPVHHQAAAQGSPALPAAQAEEGGGEADAQQNGAHRPLPPFQEAAVLVRGFHVQSSVSCFVVKSKVN